MEDKFDILIIKDFIDTFINLFSEDDRKKFDLYFNENKTYEEIGLYFNVRRQAIQQFISHKIKKIKLLLQGREYKKNYASTDILKLKSQILKLFDITQIHSLATLQDNFNAELKDFLFYIRIFCLSLDIYIYEVDTIILLSKMKFTKEYLDTLFKSITTVLNDFVLGIDEVTLISTVKKKNKNIKINNEDIISICNLVESIEFINNKFFLKIDKLSSYDKKAMRLLYDKGETMSGREIAISILNLSDKSYSEGKVNAIINSMTNNEFIEPIGATGFWALKSWEYESSYHIDLIKKVFQTQNKPLSSREIFSEVCAKRPDLTLPNIRAYLYYNKNIFSQIDSDLFIINAWKKIFKRSL